MIEFSLLLPTRDRAFLVKRLFETILRTTASLDSVEVLLYIDEDDDEGKKIGSADMNVLKVVGKQDSMGNMFQKMFEASSGRYLILMNDDVLIKTNEWDRETLRAFANFPDEVALLYPNDLYYGKSVCTFPILSRSMSRLLGRICPAEYYRHCIDAHYFDLFQKLAALGHERRVYLKHVVFQHMQYALGISALNGEPVAKNGHDDQKVYMGLDELRSKQARVMAEHIKSYDGKSGAGFSF